MTVNRKERQESIDKLLLKLGRFKKITDQQLTLDQNPYESGTAEYNQWNLDQINKLSKLEEYKKLTTDIYAAVDTLEATKPIFTVDIATAYDHFFDENEFKYGKFEDMERGLH
ncbi:hypothetical protein [Flavobacterium sp.]|uniref:hypothetical protein n=1 Tax=Flavobacterium sp. TaxID=239 RepID=UPI00374CFDB3